MAFTLASLLCLLAPIVGGQVEPAVEYTTGFNSSFRLSPTQIETAKLDDSIARNIETIMRFDQSQLAYGGPLEDEFYELPPLDNDTALLPGQVLKVQPFTDPSSYSIPAGTALSRITYVTANANGTIIPTTAFLLWPYTPRTSKGNVSEGAGAANVVIWNHGTSGFFSPQSPSSHRSLWYDDGAPFALAEAGYVVLAPDFAGLGISKSWDGSDIPHQYHASPSTARDGLYGLRAALKAFPGLLNRQFVTIGHSQGGGVSWAVGEVLAAEADEFSDLLPGYRGSVAASPTTRVFQNVPDFVVPPVALMLDSIYPEFSLDEWLSPLGQLRLKLVQDIQGGIGVWQQLFMSPTNETLIKPEYNETWYVDAFSAFGDAGRKKVAGPLLVLQGTADDYIPYEITQPTVKETCKLHPSNDIEFLVAAGVGHVPVLRAAKHQWLQWIQDRFDGVPTAGRCVRTDLESLLPVQQYLKASTGFRAWAGLPEYSYQVPLAV